MSFNVKSKVQELNLADNTSTVPSFHALTHQSQAEPPEKNGVKNNTSTIQL
jgi:hypothetical protein